ncbi:MOSC domain-containing protein [Micrococcales bacterium 31B]|nr:MOSC domain-containing protein [Micrococcales bacterium 31B]
MNTPTITAVCRVFQLQPDEGRVGATAIDKRPVEGAVRVTVHGLMGDTCLDHEHHGGADQALYLYAEEAAAEWEAELASSLAPGQFGENLRTRGIAVDDAVMGSVWKLGDTVRIEFTKPRIPCQTFARWMQQPQWVKRFTSRGLAGAYARVLTPGLLTQGDAILVESVPAHGVTIRDFFTDPRESTARLAALAPPSLLAEA